MIPNKPNSNPVLGDFYLDGDTYVRYNGEKWVRLEERLYTKEEVDMLKVRYANEMSRDLQAKVLQWYVANGSDPEFAKFFGIQSARKGKID